MDDKKCKKANRMRTKSQNITLNETAISKKSPNVRNIN